MVEHERSQGAPNIPKPRPTLEGGAELGSEAGLSPSSWLGLPGGLEANHTIPGRFRGGVHGGSENRLG